MVQKEVKMKWNGTWDLTEEKFKKPVITQDPLKTFRKDAMQEKSDQQKGGYKPVHKETTSKLSKKITATVKIFMLNFMLNS